MSEQRTPLIKIGARDAENVAEPRMERVAEHIVEFVSDSGEGAQTAGQLFGTVCALMGNVVDFLRFKYGMTCEGNRKYFEKVIGREVGLPEWDCWMQQCDSVASYG